MGGDINSKVLHLTPGEIFDWPSDFLLKLERGAVAQYLEKEGVQSFITKFWFIGDCILPIKGDGFRHDFQALDEASASLIPMLAVPEKTLNLHIINHLTYTQALGFAVARLDARARVLWFVKELHKKFGVQEFPLPMTRQHMADHLGLTIETVSRNLSKLKKEGLIGFENSKSITICSAKIIDSSTLSERAK